MKTYITIMNDFYKVIKTFNGTAKFAYIQNEKLTTKLKLKNLYIVGEIPTDIYFDLLREVENV